MITGECTHDRGRINDYTIYSGPNLSRVGRAEDVSADDWDIWPTPNGPNASKSPVQPHRHCAGCGRWLPLTRNGRIPVHDAGFSGECQGSRAHGSNSENVQESGESRAAAAREPSARSVLSWDHSSTVSQQLRSAGISVRSAGTAAHPAF